MVEKLFGSIVQLFEARDHKLWLFFFDFKNNKVCGSLDNLLLDDIKNIKNPGN